MKITSLFLKNLKEHKRDKKNLFLILIFPILIMVSYSLILGGGISDLDTVNIGVLNLDDGDYSNDLLNRINEMEIDNNTKMFKLSKITSEKEGSEQIKNEIISAYIIIPSNYTKCIKENNLNTNIIIKGEPTSIGYLESVSGLNILLNNYSKEIYQNITHISIGEINLLSKELEGMDLFNSFDYLAPGLIVFSILMNITSITTSISNEAEKGMLKRLKLTKMKSKDYIFGTTCSWILIGIIEMIAVLITAILCGYHWQGGVNSIILALITAILALISSISIALIIVSLTKTSSQASSLSLLIAFPLSFISGSFYPLPEANIGTFFGHTIQIYDILPWNQTITIFRQVLTFGKGIETVWFNMLLIILSGTVLLLISVALFNRKIKNSN